MIIFKSLKYKNFLSTGDHFTEIELNTHRNTIMVGVNGAGKSTILDALTFVLFNKPFRKINKSQLINSINGRNCLVELDFSVSGKSYTVIRGIKPNIFEVYCEGKMLNQDSSSVDQQNYFEQNILKLNFKSFTQIVVLGSSTFVPFMQLSAAQRREIIEDLLDIKIFSGMNSLLKDKIKEVNESIKQYERDLSLIENKIEIQENYIKTIQNLSDKNVKEKNDKISEYIESQKQYDEQIKTLETKLESLNECYQGTSGFEEKLKKLESYQWKFKQKIETISETKNFYDSHNVCPQCNQEIDDELKNSQVHDCTEKIEKLNIALSDVKSEWEKVSDILSEKNKVLKEINKINNDLQILNFSYQQTNKEISLLNKKIFDIQNSTNEIQKEFDKLSKLNKHQEKITKLLEETIVQKNEHSFVASLLKDTGIKTQIVKKYLPIMNNLINQYLQKMDFHVTFKLDENFNEVIKSRHVDEFSYTSFSEGEKARIDIALMLTWRVIAKMKNSMDTNILILDEIFDSSLDTTATDELSFILRTFADDVNLFIISHRDHMNDKFDRILKFRKQQNFSVMEEL